MKKEIKIIVILFLTFISISNAAIIEIPIMNVKTDKTDETHYHGLFWTLYYRLGDRAYLLDASWIRLTSNFINDTLYIYYPFQSIVKTDSCFSEIMIEMNEKAEVYLMFSTYKSNPIAITIKPEILLNTKGNEIIRYEKVYFDYSD